MKKKLKRFGIAAMVAVFTMFLSGCDDALAILEWLLSDPTVDLLELSDVVTAPVKKKIPSKIPIMTTQYTGSVK